MQFDKIILYIYIIIIIYGTMLATSCDLNAPRCTTKVPQVRLHRSLGGAFIDHRPPRTPVIPCSNNIYIMSRQRSFTSVQTFHTHTHTHIYTCHTDSSHTFLQNVKGVRCFHGSASRTRSRRQNKAGPLFRRSTHPE